MGEKYLGQLTAKSTPATGDIMVLEDSEDTKKIDYDALANAILNKLTTKTYTVAGGSNTLIAAIDALNSNAQLTITRTENSYADATSVGRLSARKRGNMLFLNFNLELTSGTTSDFTEICRISGWNAVSNIYTNIPCQTNGSSVILVSINSSGIVKIYCGTGTITDGFYRAFFCIPCNS